MDMLDQWESDEFLGDESFNEHEIVPKKLKKGLARRRYERLMEDKYLKKELEDDIGYW